MTKNKQTKKGKALKKSDDTSYSKALLDIKNLVQEVRYASARSVNAIMTATYWKIGRKIVEVEQKGQKRADYGKKIIQKMSKDLTKSCGKGFSERNLKKYRQFYLLYSRLQKRPTLSAQFNSFQKGPTLSAESIKRLISKDLSQIQKTDFSKIFPLPWSTYVRLLSVEDDSARKFYEDEALRGGWSVRQLDRQISSQFYTRTLLSKNKVKMLTEGVKAKPEDKVTPEEAVKDPYVLEFLNLKDEYSESELEEALILHLEQFLMELGGDLTFVGRQKRLRIGDDWFRVDLVFYHRLLNCLVLIELKVNDFTYADAGQMNMYLNYAKEHWTNKNENAPIGLILCTGGEKTLVKYALQGMSNKILATKYQTKLPSPKLLSQEIEKTKKMLSLRKQSLFDDNKTELKKTKAIKKVKKSKKPLAKKIKKKRKKSI